MNDITYTSFEAAQYLGVSESTVRRQCANGTLVGAFRAVMRRRQVWMIPLSALEGAARVLQPISSELEGDQPGDPH